MVPFERALVSCSYRPFIVTLPLCLRVSEILQLLFSRMPLFPYSTSSLPLISPCSSGSRWIAFSLQRAKSLGKLSVQLVSKISNLCDHNPPMLQTDGRTDDMRSQDCALHESALRGKKDDVFWYTVYLFIFNLVLIYFELQLLSLTGN